MRDLRQAVLGPWRDWVTWADANRMPSWWAALLLGLLLTLPWLVPTLQDVGAVQDGLAQWAQQQDDVRVLEEGNIALTRRVSTEVTLPAMPDGVAQLILSAHAQGLQASNVLVGKPNPVVMSERMNVQQLPVNLRVQGAWADWQHWIARWPETLPGVTLTGLELQAQPNGDVLADMSVRVPQNPMSQPSHQLSAESGAPPLPSTGLAVDALAWVQLQQQSRQHASFAPWRVSELNRVREPLESVARERVHYAGHLQQEGRTLALLRVTQHEQAALAEFHAVGVGAYLGHDMGRIEAIDPQQLHLRELVRDPNGTWRVRTVLIPFKEGGP